MALTVLIPNDNILFEVEALLTGRMNVAEWKQRVSFETHAWSINKSDDFMRILWGAPYRVEVESDKPKTVVPLDTAKKESILIDTKERRKNS